MARRLTLIDQRLAAQTHKLQIVRIQAADNIGLLIERDMMAQVHRVKDLVVRASKLSGVWTPKRINWLRTMIDEGFDLMMDEAEDSYKKSLEDFAELSYDWARTLLLRTLPRWYFRNVLPLALTGEATVNPPPPPTPPNPITPKKIVIPKKVFDKYVLPALEVQSYVEPVADADPMTQEEFEAFAKEVIFPPLTRSMIETIVESDQWRKTFPGNKSKFNDPAFRDRLVNGIADGVDVEKLTNSIRDLEAGVYWKARRTARTESLRVAEAAQRETWDDLTGMMDGVQILAVLDQNTRPEHAARNGQIYATQPQAGELPMDELPMLPDEPNCRCWTTPVLAPPDEVANDPAMQAVFANMEGANIPDPAAYDKWFDQADDGQRRLAVGTRRYNDMASMLDGSRKPEWSDFIDPKTGSLLSRNDLQRETPGEREDRKRAANEVFRQREAMLKEVAAKGFIGR